MSELDYVSPESHLWWTQSADDAGKSLMNMSEAAEQDNLPRRTRAAYNHSLLEGLGMSGLGAWAYGQRCTGPATVLVGAKQSPLIWNYPAAALDTLQPKVAGGEDKPFIMVTDGDWDDERRAMWTTRLLEGLYKQPQGMYLNVHDLGRAAFKIAAGVTGTVAVKVQPYPDENRIICELHDTLDMWIDAFECSYTNPLTFGEQTWFDPHRLMAAYPKHKQQIWDAREPLPYDRGGGDPGNGTKTRYMVKLVEGWRCKLGKENGRYVAAIKTCTLVDEEYEANCPPFAFLHARRSLSGFWGVPVLERGMRIAERINQIVATLDDTEVLLPKNLLIYDVKRTPRELMKNISSRAMQIGFNSEVGGVDPQYITPPLYDQSVINLLEFHIRAFHETLGISTAQMQAKKDPGIVAAAAIRTVNDMFTELFSTIQGDFRDFKTKQLGSLHVKAVAKLAEENPDFAVHWKGGSFMKQVQTRVCDLDEGNYVFDVMPVSETRDTPSDRIQLADEMLTRKELSPEAYQRVLRTGDVPRETTLQSAQYDYIESCIDSWMYDDLEDVVNDSPLPWFNHGDSIVQVLGAYVKALIKRNFDPQRELYFRRWITQSDQLLRRQEAERAALQGAARGGSAAPELLQGVPAQGPAAPQAAGPAPAPVLS